MIFFISVMALAAIAATVRIVVRDGYGRLPDRMAETHLEHVSGARHPRRDFGAA